MQLIGRVGVSQLRASHRGCDLNFTSLQRERDWSEVSLSQRFQWSGRRLLTPSITHTHWLVKRPEEGWKCGGYQIMGHEIPPLSHPLILFHISLSPPFTLFIDLSLFLPLFPSAPIYFHQETLNNTPRLYIHLHTNSHFFSDDAAADEKNKKIKKKQRVISDLHHDSACHTNSNRDEWGAD